MTSCWKSIILSLFKSLVGEGLVDKHCRSYQLVILSIIASMSAAGPGQCSGWSEWEVMAYYLLNVHTLARRIHQQPRWLPLNVATFTHFIIHTTLPSVNVLHITSIITATEALFIKRKRVEVEEMLEAPGPEQACLKL